MVKQKDELMNVVYGLFCACSNCREGRPGEIRYVGQTMNGLARRFRDHLRTASKPPATRTQLISLPVYRWIGKHGVDNIRAVLLDSCEDSSGLDTLEKFWIDELGTFGEGTGLNLSEGGIGLQGYAHTSESKAKMKKNFEDRSRRMMSSKPGESHPLATFTEAEVLVVKQRLWQGERAWDIAIDLGVPLHRIQQINADKSWNHVPWPIGPRIKPRRRSVFSREDRERVQALLKSGRSMHSVAREFGVSVTAVFRVAHPVA